jgi:hypothetical protein
MLEAQIAAVAQQFAREAIKLENLKEGTSATIDLAIKTPSRWETSKVPTIELSCSFFDGSNHGTVKAGSLGALMDEVHRRCGFADKQALVMDQNDAALRALAPPRKTLDNDDYKMHPPVHQPLA